MRRYSTPTIKLTVDDIDLTDAAKILVTFDQGHAEILTKEPSAVTYDTGDSILSVDLSENETALFDYRRPVRIEINILTSTGERIPSDIVEIPIFENLLNRSMSDA